MQSVQFVQVSPFPGTVTRSRHRKPHLFYSHSTRGIENNAVITTFKVLFFNLLLCSPVPTAATHSLFTTSANLICNVGHFTCRATFGGSLDVEQKSNTHAFLLVASEVPVYPPRY